MGAIANDHTSGLQPALAPSVRRAIQQYPLSAIRTVDLDEMREISGVTKFFILVAAPTDKSEVALAQTYESDLFPGLSASLNNLEGFKAAKMQVEKNYSESDVIIGEVKVNFVTMEADRQGEPIFLTALEFKTLRFLIAHARRVVSRDELLNEVWGNQTHVSNRTVDNVVAKLRKKLEEHPARPVHLRTVHGLGYKFLP